MTWLRIARLHANNARTPLLVIICFTSIELESQQTSASRVGSTPPPSDPSNEGVPCPDRASQLPAHPQSPQMTKGLTNTGMKLINRAAVSPQCQPHSRSTST